MTVIWIASVDGGATLVKRLAEQGNGTPCYEEVAANPFAARDSPSGLHYLCTALLLQDRAFRKAVHVAGGQAQRPARRKNIPLSVSLEESSRPFVLCDFHPSKSLIEAEYILPHHEQRETVRSLYRLLHIPEPDLAVYLRAASDVIASRLRRQDMAGVDTSAIERACQAHDAFFRRYRGEKWNLTLPPLITLMTLRRWLLFSGKSLCCTDAHLRKGNLLFGGRRLENWEQSRRGRVDFP